MTARLRTGAFVLIVVLIGLTAVYAVRTAIGEDPDTPREEPQLEGRVTNEIFGESDEGPFILLCEFDARVDLDGAVVVRVTEQGDRKPVFPGDSLVREIDDPIREGVTEPEQGSQGRLLFDIGVYWDDAGNLVAGCAPESIKTTPEGSGPLGTPSRQSSDSR